MRRPAAVYRLFDEDGNLLYVGISYTPLRRFSQHLAKGRRWHSSEVEWFSDRATAEDEEAVAIWQERPRWNKANPVVEQHRPRRGPRLADVTAAGELAANLLRSCG